MRYPGRKTIIGLAAFLVLGVSFVLWKGPEDIFRAGLKGVLRLQGVKTETQELAGMRLNYFHGGSDREEAVVLVHGMGANACLTWFRLLPSLEEKYHVLAPQLFYGSVSLVSKMPGYGADKELLLIRRTMREAGMDKAHFVGFSTGGWLALRLALAHPELVRSLVLVDSPGLPSSLSRIRSMDPDKMQPEELWDLLFENSPPVPGWIVRSHGESFLQTLDRLKDALESMRKKDGLRAEQLSDIQIPALIIWGRQDGIVPLEYGHKLHEAIPKSCLEVLDDCGHAVIWDRADRLESLVLDFLGESP